MKKILIVSFILFLSSFYVQTSTANEYSTYQEIEFEHSGMEFLDDYTQDMYDKYYKKIAKSRFWGWRIYTVFETEKCYYLKETLWVIENEGYSPITNTFSFSADESVKKQFNVSGTIEMRGTGETAGFKLGLEERLSYSATATSTTSIQKDFDIKVQVDPNTKLYIEIRGEGKVSNGVGKYYRFWKSVRKGGWEVFLVTTEYYSIRKEVIDESLYPYAIDE